MSAANAALPPPPVIGEDQRLGATLVLSLLFHGLLILGVGFALERAAPVVPMLDVILTQTQSPLTQKQADFLAQASNQGGGEHDKASRPRDPQPGTVPQTESFCRHRRQRVVADTIFQSVRPFVRYICVLAVCSPSDGHLLRDDSISRAKGKIENIM